MAPCMIALFFFIYYRLGLMGADVFIWQFLVAIALIIPAGWLLIWRMSLRRRIVTLILWGVLYAFYSYITDILPPWILMSSIPEWLPLMFGALILSITLTLAYLPSRDAANRSSQQ
jgi:hypothetical protein